MEQKRPRYLDAAVARIASELTDERVSTSGSRR
jgi:hypothetical protein